MKVVVDTSVLIDFLRKGEATITLFGKLKEQNVDFFIPTIVIYELFSGKSSSIPSISKTIENLIGDFKRVELTEKIAKTAGELYRNTGKTFSAQDYIIAASAMEIGATVVTLNTKHFSQIPHLRLYEF